MRRFIIRASWSLPYRLKLNRPLMRQTPITGKPPGARHIFD
jgi:hypothetical protein